MYILLVPMYIHKKKKTMGHKKEWENNFTLDKILLFFLTFTDILKI